MDVSSRVNYCLKKLYWKYAICTKLGHEWVIQNPVHPFHITYLVIFSSYVTCHVHDTYMLQLGRVLKRAAETVWKRHYPPASRWKGWESSRSDSKQGKNSSQPQAARTCKWALLDLENQPEPRHNDRHCAVDMNENDAPHLQGGYRSARNMSHSLTNGLHFSSFNSCSVTENAPDCCPPAKKDLDLSCASLKYVRVTLSNLGELIVGPDSWTRNFCSHVVLDSCSLLTTHMVQSCHVCQAELLVLHAAKYNSKSRRPCDNMW